MLRTIVIKLVLSDVMFQQGIDICDEKERQSDTNDSQDTLASSNSKTGSLARSVVINEAINAQMEREKDIQTAKLGVMQTIRNEIDDQHRICEDELKTVVIEVSHR